MKVFSIVFVNNAANVFARLLTAFFSLPASWSPISGVPCAAKNKNVIALCGFFYMGSPGNEHFHRVVHAVKHVQTHIASHPISIYFQPPFFHSLSLSYTSMRQQPQVACCKRNGGNSALFLPLPVL